VNLADPGMRVLYNGSNWLGSLLASSRAIEIVMRMGEFEVIDDEPHHSPRLPLSCFPVLNEFSAIRKLVRTFRAVSALLPGGLPFRKSHPLNTREKPLLLDLRYPHKAADFSAPFRMSSDFARAISEFGEIKKHEQKFGKLLIIHYLTDLPPRESHGLKTKGI